MAIIQIQIGKNTIEDLLLDGGFGINIITKQLKLKLGLPKLKPAPYNLKIIDQTTTKPMGLIRDLNIYVHSIPYICRNPTLAKCGGEAQHLEKLEVGSLPGLPKVQSSTARGETPCIRMFLVSLERS